MPYSSNAELPAYVKKLPDNKQRQWRQVFNSCMDKGGDDAKCFKMANGVVKRSKSEDNDHGSTDEWEFEGGEAEEREIIEYMLEHLFPEPTTVAPEIVVPLPEVKNSRNTLWEKLKSALAGGSLQRAVTGEGIAVIKQADGRYRWFARYSNSWQDRDGEIITEAAHKEYIGWAYDTGTFPELWMWHTPGTRVGEADWLEFSDGFAHASGTIDNGKESVVEKVASQDAGVSHGFLSLQAGKYIQRYRSYEVSVLPREYAAVATTGFNLLTAKEGDMAFTGERRAFLVNALGEEMVKGLEQNTEQTAEQLKQLGVEYKSSEEKKEAASEAQTEGFKALAEQVATLTATVGQLAGVVAEQKKSLDQVSKSDDEKVEDAFLARVAKAFGQNGGIVRPTESAKNVGGAADTPEPDTKQTDFFSTMIAEQFGMAAKSIPSAGVGSSAVAAVSTSGEQGPTEVRGE